MAAGGGGAWKVAYADFVTAMMAFFLVMWIVAMNKPAVNQAIAGYFRDPSGGGKSILPGKSNSLLPNPPGGMIPNPKLATGTTPPRGKQDKGKKPERGAGGGAGDKPRLGSLVDGDRFAVATMVAFPEESAELDETGKQALEQIASELSGKRSKIEVRGHASLRSVTIDDQPRDAWDVSYARAVAAMKYLAQQGIDPRRIRLSESAGFEPNLKATAAGLNSPNSFVEIYVLNEIVSDPGENPQPAKESPKKTSVKDRFKPKVRPKMAAE